MKTPAKLSIAQSGNLKDAGRIRRRTVVVAVFLCLAGLVEVDAALMTYVWSGTGSGRLSSNSFVNAPFTITSTADTSEIVERPYQVLLVTNITATVSISGFDTATFTIPTQTVANRENSVVGLGAPVQDDPVLFVGGTNFATYDLSPSPAPISGWPSRSFGARFATTLGAFSLDDVSTASFRAVLGVKLNVSLTSTNTAVVSWPWPSTGLVLQQAESLTIANWGTSTEVVDNDGTNNFIVVNPHAGTRFYRLLYP